MKPEDLNCIVNCCNEFVRSEQYEYNNSQFHICEYHREAVLKILEAAELAVRKRIMESIGKVRNLKVKPGVTREKA